MGTTAAGVLSGAGGAALGVLGGAFQSWKWGQLFGGLWAENRVKESCGEFPQHPETAAILAKDYAGAL